MCPVGYAGGGFVYTAISSGLQSENTCMGQCRGGADRGPTPLRSGGAVQGSHATLYDPNVIVEDIERIN